MIPGRRAIPLATAERNALYLDADKLFGINEPYGPPCGECNRHSSSLEFLSQMEYAMKLKDPFSFASEIIRNQSNVHACDNVHSRTLSNETTMEVRYGAESLQHLLLRYYDALPR